MAQRILLVDDELHILKAAEFKLKQAGYQVVCACDGEQAWEQIQQQVPDLVVTDLQMPRLNGLELVERIRANPLTRQLPVIMLTAKGFELTRKETCEDRGVLEVVAKPFSPRDLCARVQRALQQAPPPEPSTAPLS